MREIKFRAWDISKKKMVDCFSVGFWVLVSPENDDDEGNNSYELESELYPDGSGKIECFLMQYTGMKDKNGNEIYEGDIVRIWTSSGFGYKAEVMFNDGCFEVVHEWRDYLKVYVGNYSVEVIGNIYETPDMIEKS